MFLKKYKSKKLTITVYFIIYLEYFQKLKAYLSLRLTNSILVDSKRQSFFLMIISLSKRSCFSSSLNLFNSFWWLSHWMQLFCFVFCCPCWCVLMLDFFNFCLALKHGESCFLMPASNRFCCWWFLPCTSVFALLPRVFFSISEIWPSFSLSDCFLYCFFFNNFLMLLLLFSSSFITVLSYYFYLLL